LTFWKRLEQMLHVGFLRTVGGREREGDLVRRDINLTARREHYKLAISCANAPCWRAPSRGDHPVPPFG